MSNIFADLQAESERQKQAISQEPITITPKHTKATVVPVQSTRKFMPQATQKLTSVRRFQHRKPTEKRANPLFSYLMPARTMKKFAQSMSI
jgi:hypothetical protein